MIQVRDDAIMKGALRKKYKCNISDDNVIFCTAFITLVTFKSDHIF